MYTKPMNIEIQANKQCSENHMHKSARQAGKSNSDNDALQAANNQCNAMQARTKLQMHPRRMETQSKTTRINMHSRRKCVCNCANNYQAKQSAPQAATCKPQRTATQHCEYALQAATRLQLRQQLDTATMCAPRTYRALTTTNQMCRYALKFANV